MAENAVQILVEARGNAQAHIAGVTQSLAGLRVALAALATPVGIFGALATGAIAAGTAALTLGRQMADTVEQLDRLSSRTGVSVENLQVMRQVIDESGGNVEGLTTALTFLNRAIANGEPILGQLGITTKDAFEAFRQLADAFSRSDDTAKKNAISFKLLGRGGADLIADMEALTKAFDSTNASMRANGSLITGDVLPAARELDAEFDKLGQTMKGVWTSTAAAAQGAALSIVRSINGVIEAGRSMTRGGLSGLFNPFRGAGAGAGVTTGLGGQGAAPGAGKDPLAAVLLGDKKKGSGEADLATLLRHALIPDQGELENIKRSLPKFKVSDFVEVPEARESPFMRVLGDWNVTVAEMLKSASVLREGLGAVFYGLQRGFTDVFVGLTSKAQTFRSAVASIFRALVQEILAQLAALAAASVFQLLLKIVGVAVGVAVGGPAGAGAAIGGFATGPAPTLPQIPVMSGGGLSSARAGGNVYNISTISMDGVLQSLQSGALRQAGDTLRFQGAY